MNFRDLGYDSFGSRRITGARKLTQQEIRNLFTYGNFLTAHKGDGTQIFNVDTTNGWVQIGKPQPASNYDPNVNLYLTDDIDDYYAVNMQNLSDSDQASTDFVLLNDSTTPLSYLEAPTTGYMDIGVNSSTYNNPDYGLFTASSEFIDVADDLFIGTIGTNHGIYFYIGGHDANDKIKLSINKDGVLNLFSSASPPPYVEGGVYYDTTVHKLRIGGENGWETLTSTADPSTSPSASSSPSKSPSISPSESPSPST